MSVAKTVGMYHPASAPDFVPAPLLRELQSGRLRTIVTRAWERVELFRSRLEERGLSPDSISSIQDIAKLPFTVKTDLRDTYPFGLFASPHGRGRAPARLQRHHRQAHRGGLHAGRPGRLDLGDGAQLRRLRPAPRRHRPERLRLRAVHRRAGRALRRRGAGRHRDSHLRRQHRPPDHGDEGFRRDRHLLHAQLLPAHDGARRRAGRGRAAAAAARRRFRRRAVDRVHAQAHRGA